jgi:hypothetical protein
LVAVALVGVDVTGARSGWALLISAVVFGTASAQPETMRAWSVTAKDRPSDGGGTVRLVWTPVAPPAELISYEIQRAAEAGGPFTTIGTVLPLDTTFDDASATTGEVFFYRVAALSAVEAPAPAERAPGDTAAAIQPARTRDTLYTMAAGPVHSTAQWFNFGRLNQLVVGILLSTAIIYFISRARSGKQLYVRKIAGLQAVEEAIGRATEMGRPILFIPGIQDMDDVQTIAGLTILARVARTVAEYETTLNVPVSRSLVMTTARESIKEAYQAAGRPDAYNDQMVHYVTDEQFGYVAAVDGIMVRQKPATCLYMGAFFAESLIVAETGSEIGAIQIAGTAQPAQLPFFVAACDYTLIGEELFAASAYLSGEPRQLGSLKGQDVGKLLAMGALGLGAALLTLSSLSPQWPILIRMADWVGKIFQVR